MRQVVWLFMENQLIKGHHKLLTNKVCRNLHTYVPKGSDKKHTRSLGSCPNAPKLGERVLAQDAVDQVRRDVQLRPLLS